VRNKIIAVNAIIVVIIGLLSFVIVRSSLSSSAGNPAQLSALAKHDAQAAAARFQLDGLRVERFLAGKANESATLDAINKGTPTARGEAATALCDQIMSVAKGQFEGAVPSLVELVDQNGKIVGRNGSTMGRGDDLAAAYPGLKDALAKSKSGSDVWSNKERNDQYLASYVPIVDGGQVKGALVMGTTLNDELARVSDGTTGRPLVLVVSVKDDLAIAAHSANAEALTEAVTKVKGDIKGAITSGHTGVATSDGLALGAAPLESLGDGKRGAILSSAPTSLIPDAGAMAYPILGVMGLGLVLVVIGGWLLGNYIQGPIATLEEGLLTILNGQTDKRFELDHAELGGLAFRIDQLLNQLMGIEEDTTDDEGRPSTAPTAANFAAAMGVDRSGGGGGDIDPAAAAALAAEPAQAYYGRIYKEYIAAKKAIGEATDHITEQAFHQKIQGMENEASAKFGKPVRYKVQPQGKEVVLLAIPLG
jgi:hypothetical protein